MIPREIVNFEIIRLIGEGRTGKVFLARNKSTHQFVAIKMLHPHLAANPSLREQLRAQSSKLSSLEHDNIARFINFIENDEGAFIVMEYVDGVTLEDFILRRNGLIVESRAVPLMQDVLNAMSYAHSRGVVHGAIGLRNLILTKDGHVKVLNFGVKAIARSHEEPSATFEGIDTYTAPEVLNRAVPDFRTDVYSLGIIFQEMLTGRSPFSLDAATPAALAAAVKNQTPLRLKSVYPYISDSLQEVVDKAASKNPAERYSDAADMKKALDRAPLMAPGEFDKDEGKKSRAGKRNDQSSKAADKYLGKSQNKKLKLWQIILICLGVLLILGGGAFAAWWFLGKDKPQKFCYYTDVNGVPKGIQVFTGKGPHYEITYKDGRVDQLRLVDEEGKLYATPDSVYAVFRPVMVKYSYARSGEPVSKTVFDSNGDELYTLTYRDGMTRAKIKYSHPEFSEITDLRLIYDVASGRLIKEEFIDEDGNPVQRKDGVYGHRYQYDGSGRLTRVINVDKNNTTKMNEAGVATILFEYSSGVHDVTTTYYDVKDIIIRPEESRDVKASLQTDKTSKKDTPSRSGDSKNKRKKALNNGNSFTKGGDSSRPSDAMD